ncbi:laminin subunit beta-1-like isoform X3 [Oncorhynchus keta]|uniref:laminin subunit beta-1-like isoform X3 n=1 Tax=Oncorhynchus keta TaxID=8018 RepID=UPI00227A050E|nr:laminin subunit beta-1-like isoform X3 [Oncorhynchus keta]
MTLYPHRIIVVYIIRIESDSLFSGDRSVSVERKHLTRWSQASSSSLDHYTNKAEDANFGSIMLMPHCKNLEIFTVSGGGDVATNNPWDTFQRYLCLDNSQRVIKTSSTSLEETTQGSLPQTSSNGF